MVCHRLDGKKSVYKKVSEDKTKVEIEKEGDVEMKDAEDEKKDDEEMKDADDSDSDSDLDDDEVEKGTIRKARLRNDAMHNKMGMKERDPWGLTEKSIQKDMGKMKCPPLELFCWNRVVIDEFHYLSQKQDRARVLTLVLGLKR